MTRDLLSLFRSSLLLIVFILGAHAASAVWSNPPAGTPPACSDPAIPGCNPPLNVSGTFQSKSGGFDVANTFSAIGGIFTGNVGIGTASPSYKLHLAADGNANIALDRASANATGNYIYSYKSRGTQAAPAVITTGDDLLLLRGYGYGGATTGDIEAARIQFDTEGTVADGRVPGMIKFFTTTDAAPSVLTQRMVIDSSGDVGIGTASPTEKLQIIGGNISIPATTATAGIIKQGSSPVFHTFGSANTFVGGSSGNFTMAGVGGNTGTGFKTLFANVAGVNNSAFGKDALSSNTSGNDNAAFGAHALQANITGNDNVAFGNDSLLANTGGYSNTAVGDMSLWKNLGGKWNTAIGMASLQNSTSGDGNVAIGYNSLSPNTTGTYNTALGFSAGVGSGNLTKATAIGSGASVTASNTMALGGTGADAVNVILGGTATSPNLKLDVEGKVGATEYCDNNGNNCSSASGIYNIVNGGSTPTISEFFIDGNQGMLRGTPYAMGKVGGSQTTWSSYTERVYNMGSHNSCFLSGFGTGLENHSCYIEKSGSNWTLKSNKFGDDVVGFCSATCIN